MWATSSRSQTRTVWSACRKRVYADPRIRRHGRKPYDPPAERLLNVYQCPRPPVSVGPTHGRSPAVDCWEKLPDIRSIPLSEPKSIATTHRRSEGQRRERSCCGRSRIHVRPNSCRRPLRMGTLRPEPFAGCKRIDEIARRDLHQDQLACVAQIPICSCDDQGAPVGRKTHTANAAPVFNSALLTTCIDVASQSRKLPSRLSSMFGAQ